MCQGNILGVETWKTPLVESVGGESQSGSCVEIEVQSKPGVLDQEMLGMMIYDL